MVEAHRFCNKYRSPYLGKYRTRRRTPTRVHPARRLPWLTDLAGEMGLHSHSRTRTVTGELRGEVPRGRRGALGSHIQRGRCMVAPEYVALAKSTRVVGIYGEPLTLLRGLRCIHAKNKIAGRFILFLILDFWDKHTGICAGTMPSRRDFPATTGI